MKLVPKRRFKGFSGEWEEHALEKIMAEFIVPMRDKPKEFGGNIPWTRIEDIEGRYLHGTKSEQYVREETIRKMNLKIIPKDSLIVSASATFGVVAIVTSDLITNQTFIGLIPSDGYDLNFLYVFLKSPLIQMRMRSKSAGSTIFYISREKFEKLKGALPSLKEQEKIGKYFANLDNLIVVQKSKLKKLQTMKQAYLHEMFPDEGESVPKRRFAGFNTPWKRRKLCSLAERFDNLRIPVKASDRIPGTTPYYGANGILDYVDGYTHDGEFVLIAEDGANDLNDYPLYYVNGKVWVNNHAHVIQAKENAAYNKFLMYAFKTIDMSSYLVGGSRPKLNAEIMMDIIVSSPCIDEQIKIGDFFSQLDGKITIQQAKVEKLKAMKQAYLNEMFV